MPHVFEMNKMIKRKDRQRIKGGVLYVFSFLLPYNFDCFGRSGKQNDSIRIR